MYSSDEPSAQTSHPPPVFCSTCGQRLQPDWQFCTRCGAHIPPVVTETSFGAVATEPQGPGRRVAWGVGDVALGTGFYIIQAISIFAIVLVVTRVAEIEDTGGSPAGGDAACAASTAGYGLVLCCVSTTGTLERAGILAKTRSSGCGVGDSRSYRGIGGAGRLLPDPAGHGCRHGRLVPDSLPRGRYGIPNRAGHFGRCSCPVRGGAVFQGIRVCRVVGEVGAVMGCGD